MSIYALNVTIDSSCLILLLSLMISQIYRHVDERQEKLFLFILIMNTVTIFGELLAWVCEGKADQLLVFMQYAGNVTAYMAGAVAGVALFVYLLGELNGRGKWSASEKILIALSAVPAALIQVLVLLNFRTGWLFSLNEEYLFTMGPLALVHDMFVFYQQVVLMAAIAMYPKAEEHIRTRIALFALMLAGASLADILFLDIALVYPVTVYVLLIIYLNLLLFVERETESTELEIVVNRYNLIINRIRPSFVNLVLLEIEKLCLGNTEKAQETISEFSDYLRANIDRIDRNELIPFEDELEHIVHYIRLVRVKYEDFGFEQTIEAKGFMIPMRTILPLAENYVINIDAVNDPERVIHLHSFFENGMNCVDIWGPALQIHTDLQRAYDLYTYISSRLTQMKGASVVFYCDLSRHAHAIIRCPRTEGGREHA